MNFKYLPRGVSEQKLGNGNTRLSFQIKKGEIMPWKAVLLSIQRTNVHKQSKKSGRWWTM